MITLALDFETANERRDSACAVGLAWIEDGEVVRRVSHLIRPPEMRFSPGNIRVHGILPADVANEPSFAEVMAPYLADLSGGVILAHNATFDIGVLRSSLRRAGMAIPTLTYLCTVQIARRVFPAPEGCGLGKVARRLGITFEHHDAGEDAYACARIALAAMGETGTRDVHGLAEAIGVPVTPVPGWLADRAPVVERAPAPRPASTAMTFLMRGSTGNRYTVTLEERTSGAVLRCTCMAGRFGQRCRHVKALEVGDITDLLSDNHSELAALATRIAGAA